jgi:hypothetical protein
VSGNPGRRVLRQGFVEALGAVMWLGASFWPLTGAKKEAVCAQRWLRCEEFPGGVVRIKAAETPFSEGTGEPGQVQDRLRSLLFPLGRQGAAPAARRNVPPTRAFLMLLVPLGVLTLSLAAESYTFTHVLPQEDPHQATTETLLAWLESESMFERVAAKVELSRRRDRAILPALFLLLEDERAGVRAGAVEVLGHFQAPGVFEAIERLLVGDRDWSVRFSAVNAFGSLLDPRAAPLLSGRAMQDGSEVVRAQAAWTLQLYPGCDAGRTLLAVLGDPDSEVQSMAGASLRIITAVGEPTGWKRWVEHSCSGSPGSGHPPIQPVTPLVPEQASGDAPDPRYLSWASFKPGSWVAKKGKGPETWETRETLKSVTPNEVVIESRMTIEALGLQAPETKTIPARSKSTRRAKSDWIESRETLTLDGQELSCRVQRSGGTTRWYCDAIPGGLAQLETKNDMGRVIRKIWVSEWSAER